MKNTVLALLAALSLSGCEFVKETIDARQYDPTDLEDIIEEKTSVEDYISDRTLNYPDWISSPQVDYYGDDGIVYTWYPEKEYVIKGTWYADVIDGYVAVCTEYPEDVFEERYYSGFNDCTDASYTLYYMSERVKGDPFNLKSGRVPYVLEFDLQLSFREMAVRANIPVGRLIEMDTPEEY